MEDEIILRIKGDGSIQSEIAEKGVRSVKQIDIDSLLDCIKSSLTDRYIVSSGLLPQNCLFYRCNAESKSYSIVLDYPDKCADINYMGTVYPSFPLPRMVFGFTVENSGRISSVKLCVIADEKPKESTPIYRYPFSNVHDSFSVCIGSNSLPEIKVPFSLSNMPRYILSLPDNDDLFNTLSNRLGLCHRELLEHLKDKTPEYYYSDILIPTGKTLKYFLEG